MNASQYPVPATVSDPPAPLRVLVYSDRLPVREAVRGAVGERPAADLGTLEWLDCSTGAEVRAAADAGGLDLLVLDGEAWPTGGLGLARQLKDEIRDCPPTLVIVARRDDAWLARWSQADAVVSHPLDPPSLIDAVTAQLRARTAGLPVRRVGA